MNQPNRPSENGWIREFLLEREWLPDVQRVSFLAAGEYNENHLVEGSNGQTVFRINHGSQLGLADQIEYEFSALRAVEPSSRTPAPMFVAGAEGDRPGVLLMEYIEGRPFHYANDDTGAAEVFAHVHRLSPSESPHASRLIVQQNPVSAIVEESSGLISRFNDHPLVDARASLEGYAETILGNSDEYHARCADEPLCIVNTEVNSGNFIVTDSGVKLVDWEKAVVSGRYQDLGHFLVPTTTLWKSDYRYDDQHRRQFLERYREYVGVDLPIDELSYRTGMMERVILLRALSWCYMAYYEYTKTARAISNQDTFRKIKRYLDELEWFLN